jgi:phosphoglycerate dehydrogenase-like enzyme
MAPHAPPCTKLRKLECLFLVDESYFPFLYGAEERMELEALAHFGHPAISPAELLTKPIEFCDVEALFATWGMPVLDAAMLRRFPNLRIVFYAAGTIKSFITPDSWRRGVRVTTAALANAKPVAEFTVAAIVFSLKRVWERMRSLRENDLYRRHCPPIPGCYGTTIGLLALGKIGRCVAAQLRQMDVRVIAYDPHVQPGVAAELNVQLCSIEEVFTNADVVSCHLPLHAGTASLIDAALLRRMKPDSTFINTARGGVVNERDLVTVLGERPDLYAVLDTITEEPPHAGNPLLRLPNAIVTPHLAGSMCHECRRMGLMMIDELRRYLAGKPLLGEVLEHEIDHLA